MRGKKADDMDMGELSEAIRKQPQQKEMMQKYEVHLNISQQLLQKLVKERKLIDMVELEQDIISGVDS